MLFLILWIVFIAINVVWHWYVIEKLKRWPNHGLWFIIRIIALVLLAVYSGGDYRSNTMGGALLFQFLFYVSLNLSRDKRIGYLSNHGFDAVIKKIFPELAWFIFFYIMMIAGFGIVLQGWPF